MEKPEKYKQIFETYSPGDIAFLKSLLQASSIDFVIENEHFSTMRPLGAVPIIVKVNVKQLEEAQELLKDFQGGQFGQGQV